MTAQEYLNTPHMPNDVPEELVPGIADILNRIPSGWGKWISLDLGWYPIIVDLNQTLSELDPNYEVHQVKEKFGSLRYYFGLSQPPELPCCQEWDKDNPMPRRSWMVDDPKAPEYLEELDLWSEAHDEHCETEAHEAAFVLIEPLLGARNQLFEQMQALVNEAEQISAVTCELCGSPGSIHARRGWVKILDQKCAEEHGFIPWSLED